VGRTSNTVEDFVRANRELLKYIEKSGSSVGQYEKMIAGTMDILTAMFNVSSAFARDVIMRSPVLGKAMSRDAVIGLHIVMYHDAALVDKLREEAGSEADKELADVMGMSVASLRECLYDSFTWVVNRQVGHAVPADMLGAKEACMNYWKKGVLLPHLGALAKEVRPEAGVPRPITANALVPWMLSVIKDMAMGSVGAGSIAVMGAGIGLGKTSTLYYTLRSVLAALGHPRPEELADKFILLDPYDFLTALEALIEHDEKAPILVVDNASALFPKQWASMGGELRRFFVNANMMINMLRSNVGATVFVANGPEELSSFIRKNSSMNITGEAMDIKAFTTAIYTWWRPTLRLRPGEEAIRKRQKVASVYVFPLLKLPITVYVKDLNVKKEVNKKKLAEAVRSLKTALETTTAVGEAEQKIMREGYTISDEPEATGNEENP